jgi:hypothetical protein
VRRQYEQEGYVVEEEHALDDQRRIDLWATRDDHITAIEVETGRSNIRASVRKLVEAAVSERILLATSADAVTACARSLEGEMPSQSIQLLTWLDVS